ncbi:antibiotic biosynthesis monooxygenase family protein [Dictyobacter formicarum]|uniref:ABM domain-containing protein n=1 Tax=Dictyobacter formicarum TaxID=2778368 RepID=A0ABQ3VUX5_9CHLR|nr:antibiotic biosynthesis monooxygenase family protein [Dictyobacter formicarum]GHO89193.1 hypothetical protein KSZ_71990 [Dictyobacter formicarum]
MFIAVNKVTVPAERQEAMMKGFEHAIPGMKQFKGFLGMELWVADDNTVLAVSRWESKEALEEYTNNDLFKQHHGGGQSAAPGQVSYYNAKVLS